MCRRNEIKAAAAFAAGAGILLGTLLPGTALELILAAGLLILAFTLWN